MFMIAATGHVLKHYTRVELTGNNQHISFTAIKKVLEYRSRVCFKHERLYIWSIKVLSFENVKYKNHFKMKEIIGVLS